MAEGDEEDEGNSKQCCALPRHDRIRLVIRVQGDEIGFDRSFLGASGGGDAYSIIILQMMSGSVWGGQYACR